MTWRTLALLWAGIVVGGLIGTAATVGVLYHRPGSAAVGKVARMLGVGSRAGDASARAASRRDYAYGHDSHRDMMQADLVRSRLSSQWEVRRGLDVELVATGFTYPVNVAFVDRPDPAPEAPRFYVSELNGKVKWVANDGSVHLFAEGLLDFTPIR